MLVGFLFLGSEVHVASSALATSARSTSAAGACHVCGGGGAPRAASSWRLASAHAGIINQFVTEGASNSSHERVNCRRVFLLQGRVLAY